MELASSPAKVSQSDAPLVSDSVKRLVLIEEKSTRINSQMDIESLKWKTEINEALNALAIMKADLLQLQDDFRQTISSFLDMIEFFKNSATREDFEKLERRISEWNPEDFIGMEEFRRLVAKRLSTEQL